MLPHHLNSRSCIKFLVAVFSDICVAKLSTLSTPNIFSCFAFLRVSPHTRLVCNKSLTPNNINEHNLLVHTFKEIRRRHW